jgi:hypothetical protein
MRTLSRIASGCNQESTLNEALINIEFEKSRRGLSFCGERLNKSSSENKMIVPPITTWIVEDHKLARLRIARADIAPFPRIASKASVGEVVYFRRPAMLAADDMVYLMR